MARFAARFNFTVDALPVFTATALTVLSINALLVGSTLPPALSADAQTSKSATLSTSKPFTTTPTNKFTVSPTTKSSATLASFAPSNTELLYSVGAQDKLVAVCSYCDYPLAAKKKTIVGNFISANFERLAAVKPGKIVLVSGQEGLAGQLAHNGYQTIVLRNDHLSDIAKNLRQLAALTGSTVRGDAAAAGLENCLNDLKVVISKATTHPSIFYCIWPQPLLTIGQKSYLSETITICGGDSISKNLDTAYPHFSLEKLVLANPDVIILPFECKDRSFLQKHPWSSLKAVKAGRVVFLPAPAEDGLARPTLRVTKGLFWLAKIIHPELSTQLDTWNEKTQATLNSFSGATLSSPSGVSKQASAR